MSAVIKQIPVRIEDYTADESENLPAELPTPDDACFYGLAGRFALEACKNSEANPMGVLMHFIAWSGAYLGNASALHLGDTVTAHPRFMVVTVGTSGAGKGTAAAPVRKLMHQYVNKRLYKMGLDTIGYKDGPMSSGEGLAYAVRDPVMGIDKDGNPTVIDEGVKDKRLFVLEEEFAAVLQASKRLGNVISAAIRRFYDPSGSFAPMTKNLPVTATNAHVGFVGHITVDELMKELDQTEYTNGFANRILWVCINRPKIVVFPDGIPTETMDSYAAELIDTVRYAQQGHSLTMSEGARALYSTVGLALAKQQGSFAERARLQVLRLSTAFALLDKTNVIQQEHLMAALAIWDYCTESVRYLFDETTNPNEEKLLHALKINPAMSQTQIYKSVFGSNMEAKKIGQLLKQLEAKGKIKREETQGAGKRKTTVFSLAD